jgi:RNA-binding protein YlmH
MTNQEIIEKISEIQSMIEREVEWPMTDYIEPSEINPTLRQINAGLLHLQIIAENISKNS